MRILLFGITKDIIGKSVMEWDTGSDLPKDVGQLKKDILNQYPSLGELSSLAIAVNSEYAQNGQALNPGDEVALIPPVSGG